VGHFPELERQQCLFSTGGYVGKSSPDHADACIRGLREVMLASAPGAAPFEHYDELLAEREGENDKDLMKSESLPSALDTTTSGAFSKMRRAAIRRTAGRTRHCSFLIAGKQTRSWRRATSVARWLSRPSARRR
jgi:hypothetical protein